MSTAGVNPAGGVASSTAQTDALRLTPRALIVPSLIGLAFIALFYQWFTFQHRFSWGSDDWAHAYIVPLISGYAIWRNRETLLALRPRIFWPGALPLALGIVCYAFFMLGFPNHMGQGFSIILALFGVALLNFGPKFAALLTFPIAYLAFGVTISERVMQGVTFELQIIASQGAWVLLNLVQIQTEIAGNTLNIITGPGESLPLNVAEACSGMRMVIAFYALGTAIAFLSTPMWWQRIALLLLAGPIAILVNVFRVASLGGLSLIDPEFAKGSAHMFIGLVWLVPAFILFMGCVWALKRIVEEPKQPGATS